jgi:hypothetical protein
VRQLGVDATVDPSVLLKYKDFNAISARWKEEVRYRTTAVDKGSSSAPANQGDALMKGACDDARGTSLNSKPDDPDAVLYDAPCDRCSLAGFPCWGISGRVCERCKSVQQRCSKSSGRGGTREKRKREGDKDTEQAAEGACYGLFSSLGCSLLCSIKAPEENAAVKNLKAIRARPKRCDRPAQTIQTLGLRHAP